MNRIYRTITFSSNVSHAFSDDSVENLVRTSGARAAKAASLASSPINDDSAGTNSKFEGTIKPSTPLRTRERTGAPHSIATTGTPHASASHITLLKPSTHEAEAKISALRRTA